MHPRRSSTTHTEQLDDEAAIYDWARAQVHALNPTAAHVWRLCDGATGPDAIAAALRAERGIPEAEAVVDLTLTELTRLHLLELPVEARRERPATTRRWLLGRGVAAAMLPVISSIVAPSPVEAQSPSPGAPTLTSLSPNQGARGTTVAVMLTGTNLIAGATTVNVSGGGMTVTNVTVVGATPLPAAVSTGTSLSANFVIDPTAAPGPRTVTVTTAGGTSGPQEFTIIVPPGSPTVSLTASANSVAGAATTFTVGAAPAPGTNATIQNVRVTFGDGNTPVDLGAVSGPTTTQHVYVAAGTYSVSATATDSGGRTSTVAMQVVVGAPGSPAVSVTASAKPVANTATTFTIGATPAPGTNATIQNVRVTFGDGSAPVDLGAVSGTTTTQHVYAVAGTYTVSATATDSGGRTSTAAVQVVVTA